MFSHIMVGSNDIARSKKCSAGERIVTTSITKYACLAQLRTLSRTSNVRYGR